MKSVRPHHMILAALTILGAVVAVERFYSHPTYGNGLEAAYAALKAAVVLT